MPAFMGAKKQISGSIAVTSLHKTLPALTQTAVLHLYGDLKVSVKAEEANVRYRVITHKDP